MKKLFFLFSILLCSFVSVLYAKNKIYHQKRSIKVHWIKCHDGDTCLFAIPSLSPVLGKTRDIRLRGIDTPEIQGKCPYEKQLAKEAKQFVISKLQNAKTVKLRSLSRGKYFRIIADVYVDKDKTSLSQQLLAKGLAYNYFGGTKRSWCLHSFNATFEYYNYFGGTKRSWRKK